MTDTPFNKQAAFLIEGAVDLIKQVLVKHSAAVLEEMHDQIVARNQRIKQLEDELEWDKTEKSNYSKMLTALGMEEEGDPVQGVADLQYELSDIATQKTMLVGQCAELVTSLRSCEKQLVTCAHAYRAADNFDEAQRCSDIAFTARLILQKWEEL